MTELLRRMNVHPAHRLRAECDHRPARTGISAMDLSDGELVTRVRGGDVNAYRQLVERHYADCLRYAMRWLGNAHDAEEAVQDAFVRAFRSLSRFDDNRKFKGWLFGILLNRCRTAGAMRGRTEGPLVSMEALTAAELSGDSHNRFDTDVQRALMTLEPSHREALLLKYVEDWTYEEIAELTGTRVSALKMRVKRARERLTELLRRVYDVT
jgi:RNA polymerase sigma-70 factor (ECF subfamily)